MRSGTKRPRRCRRLALTSIVASLLLAGAVWAGEEPRSGGASVSAVAGIERVERVGLHAIDVHSRRGICKLRVAAAAGHEVRIRFHYETGRPFSKIEGIDVFDRESGRPLDTDDLLAGGAIRRDNGEIRILAPTHSIDWTLQVIDFYR